MIEIIQVTCKQCMASSALVSKFPLGLHPQSLNRLSVDLSMLRIDEVVSVHRNLLVINAIVNSVNVIVSCSTVSNNDRPSSWQDMISYYLFQRSCVSTSNQFHPTTTGISFQNTNYPLPTPERSPMILPMGKICFVNFHVSRLSVNIESSK